MSKCQWKIAARGPYKTGRKNKARVKRCSRKATFYVWEDPIGAVEVDTFGVQTTDHLVCDHHVLPAVKAFHSISGYIEALP